MGVKRWSRAHRAKYQATIQARNHRKGFRANLRVKRKKPPTLQKIEKHVSALLVESHMLSQRLAWELSNLRDVIGRQA